jgi:Zn-dependent protease
VELFLAQQLAHDTANVVETVVVIGLIVLSLCLHEAAHAWTAWRCGDDTARSLGRLTLNPLVHIDPIHTLLLPAVLYWSTGLLFGGARPVPVSFHRLRHPWRDMALVALAGPATNFLLAFLAAVLFQLASRSSLYASDALVWDILRATAQGNLLLAAFNLLPIPPLDGSRLMAWLLPQRLRAPYVALESFGMFLVLGLFAFGALRWPVGFLTRALDGAIESMLTAVGLGFGA